jgi:hypothetical protein
MTAPSTLVSPATLPQFSQVDYSSYQGPYLQSICTAAHLICAGYLGYDPAVQTHTNEEGPVTLAHSGREVGSTVLRLKHQPLTSRDPGLLFSSLYLTYALPLPDLDALAAGGITPGVAYLGVGTAGLGDTVRCQQTSGRIMVGWLNLGTTGLGFQYGASTYGMAQTGATGYRATYTAGYAITAADVAAYPTALVVPPDMQLACALMVEVLLGQATRVSSAVDAAVSGVLQGFTNMEYTERYDRVEIKDSDSSLLLRGTQQGMWASQLLSTYRRTSAEKVRLL